MSARALPSDASDQEQEMSNHLRLVHYHEATAENVVAVAVAEDGGDGVTSYAAVADVVAVAVVVEAAAAAAVVAAVVAAAAAAAGRDTAVAGTDGRCVAVAAVLEHSAERLTLGMQTMMCLAVADVAPAPRQHRLVR